MGTEVSMELAVGIGSGLTVGTVGTEVSTELATVLHKEECSMLTKAVRSRTCAENCYIIPAMMACEIISTWAADAMPRGRCAGSPRGGWGWWGRGVAKPSAPCTTNMHKQTCRRPTGGRSEVVVAFFPDNRPGCGFSTVRETL